MTRRWICWATAAIAFICAWLLGARSAEAYPQWQLASGATRCNQCHYAPAGGGLINGYGRDAIGEDLSTWEGDGNFLHGAVELPRWLALGGDYRGAFLIHDVQDPDGTTFAAFPMQADMTARVALPAGFSLQVIGGLRGQVRKNDAVVPLQNYQPISTSRLVSREHFVTWQPAALGSYVRVGRFFAPFGLRLAEHIVYLRRDLGFGVMEESYNVSYGNVQPDWEAHLTLFTDDFVRNIGSREKGAAAYYERRLLDDRLALAGQGKFAAGEGMNRFIGGVVGKFQAIPALLQLMAELNLVHQVFESDAVASRRQFVGAVGASAIPVRGVMITVLGERSQTDIAVADTAWNALTGLFNFFPYPHVEVQLVGRLQFPSGTETAKTLMLQLHYFL